MKTFIEQEKARLENYYKKNTSSMKNSDVNEILSFALIGLLILLTAVIEAI